MLKNYLKVAVRNLLQNKTYVGLNALGMGIAMACCLAAYLLIAFNIEFDSYFDDDKMHDIVKVVHHIETTEGEREDRLVAPVNLAPIATNEVAGIQSFTRFCNRVGILSYGDKTFYEGIRFADPSFFHMFPIQLSSGSHRNYLKPNTIFLSHDVTTRYFADQDAVGEVMTVELNGKKYEVTVGGVLEKLPLNISFHIYALLPFDIYRDAYEITDDLWVPSHDVSVLFKLVDSGATQSISQQFDHYVDILNEQQDGFRSIGFELVPFTTPIVNGDVRGTFLRLPIVPTALLVFGVLALIILLIACFNLTNTTLALTGKRLKEIGVRKVVGSMRIQIAGQFLVEMIITVFVAVIAGVLIAQVLVPQFATMWQLEFGLHDISTFNMVLALVILLIATSLLAGVYPALLNSKFNPIDLLKGKRAGQGTSIFTRSLLVIQFALSVIVLIAGVVFTQNAAYQRMIPLGYDYDKILVVSVQDEREYGQFSNAISTHANVQRVAGAASHIGPYSSSDVTIKLHDQQFHSRAYRVGEGYIETVGIKMVSGRDFQRGSELDHESSIIVDEAFVKNHGLTEPLGTPLEINEQTYRIVGVASDHLSGLKQEYDDDHVYFCARPSEYRNLVLTTTPDAHVEMNDYLEKEWKKLFPDRPFINRSQVEIVYEEADGYNQNLKQIFYFITLLGCVLSASGIYAMASLNVQRRIKEISVRKVLGATVQHIVRLVGREFAILLIVAGIGGVAAGYALTDALLKDLYAQHVKIGAPTMIICAFTVFLIGIVAASVTIFRAAVSNPVKTMRSD